MSRAVRAAAACGLFLVACGAFTSGMSRGDRPMPATRALGPLRPGRRLTFSVDLRIPRSRALHRFLDDAGDPASPRFGHVLDAATFGNRFGLPDATLRRLRNYLAAAGIHVRRTFPQRTAIVARGRVDRIEDLFDTRLTRHVDPAGNRYHSPTATPVVPRPLRRAVLGISGLSTKPSLRPADIPAGGLKGPDVLEAYDGTPLRELGYDGSGETIAIVSFDSFNDSDVAVYDAATGIDGPPVEHVPVLGGTEVGDGTVEVNLDVDVIRGIAPKAQILDYEIRNGVRLGTVVDQIVADGRADIVNLSWGTCDDPRYLRRSFRRADLQSFAAATAQGSTSSKRAGTTARSAAKATISRTTGCSATGRRAAPT